MACDKRVIRTSEAPLPLGPYSQAVVANGFVFVSGQLPVRPESGVFLQGPVEEQIELVLRNIDAILRAAGSDLSRAVKVTVFLRDISDFASVNAVYRKFFGEPPPARTCVAITDLPDGVRVETDVVALV